MKQSILKQVSKREKIQFLTKLQTGHYVLGHAATPREELDFERLESGFYRCSQTGIELKQSAVKAFESQFMIMIEIVDNLTTPPTGYQFIQFLQDQILNQLLKLKK